MGRGLSDLQRDILGLAVAVAEFHGLPPDRGVEVTWEERYYWDRLVDTNWTFLKSVICVDVTNAAAVHLILGFDFVETIEVTRGDQTYIMGLAGCNENSLGSTPDVKSAKAAVSRSFKRLVARGLLRDAVCLNPGEGSGRGFVLTDKGREQGRKEKTDYPLTARLLERLRLCELDHITVNQGSNITSINRYDAEWTREGMRDQFRQMIELRRSFEERQAEWQEELRADPWARKHPAEAYLRELKEKAKNSEMARSLLRIALQEVREAQEEWGRRFLPGRDTAAT